MIEGMPRQCFRSVFDDTDQFLIGGIFRQVNGRTDAQRQRNQQRKHNNAQRIDDQREDAHGSFKHAVRLGEQRRGDIGQAAVEHIT